MSHPTVQDRIEIAKRITEKYAEGKYTIASIAETEGITPRKFTEWEHEVPEIADMYKKAKNDRRYIQRKELKQSALTSLQKLVQGFTVDEKHMEVEPIYDKEGKQIGTRSKSMRIVTKHYAPNVTAIIFALKAMDPETFKDNVPIQQTQEQEFIIGGKSIKF